MKKIYLFLLLSLVQLSLIASTRLQQLINHTAENHTAQKIEIFNSAKSRNAIADKMVKSYDVLQLNEDVYKDLLAQPAALLKTDIAVNGVTYTLQLAKADVLSPAFSVGCSGGETAQTPTHAVYYRGVVKGYESSIASLSLFDENIYGLFAMPGIGNMVIGKIKGSATNEYVVYNDRDLLIKNPFRCYAEDAAHELPEAAAKTSEAGAPSQCKMVNIYYEADHDVYVDNGSSTVTTTSFITGMFNSVATIYYNDYVNLQISRIYIWTTAHAYATSSSGDALNEFSDMREDTFNGNLGQLLVTTGSLGGVGWLNALCRNYDAPSHFGPTSYANIDVTYSAFPVYSWNIDVMSHEMGHNFGSRHTHNCDVWPGGPIDWCGPTYSSGYIEGTCTTGPMPAEGTIMSYCHLVSGVGKNLALGFGVYPRGVICNRISLTTCTDDYLAFTPAISSPTVNACVGDNILISATPTGSTFHYEWFNGATSVSSGSGSAFQTYNATTSGTYSCIVKDTNGCPVTSNSVGLNFLVPNNSISPSGTPSFCEGDSLELVAAALLTYAWSTGETTRNIWVHTGGTYSVTVTDALGCTASNSKTVSMHSAPVPVISMPGASLSAGSWASYQWYLNGTAISGANSSTYTPTVNGNYTVVVTDVNGCHGTSASFAVNNLSIEFMNGASARVFPNPASDYLKVEVAGKRFDIKIFNAEGRLVYIMENASETKLIETQKWASGDYILQIKLGEDVRETKITILN